MNIFVVILAVFVLFDDARLPLSFRKRAFPLALCGYRSKRGRLVRRFIGVRVSLGLDSRFGSCELEINIECQIS
jgi:hypothetical protein